MVEISAYKTIMETCHLVGARRCGRTPHPAPSKALTLILQAGFRGISMEAKCQPEDRDGHCFTLPCFRLSPSGCHLEPVLVPKKKQDSFSHQKNS